MRSIDETFETFGKRVLWLGYAGEEDRSTLIVDLHDILLEFPGATAVLKVRPPDEKAAYPSGNICFITPYIRNAGLATTEICKQYVTAIHEVCEKFGGIPVFDNTVNGALDFSNSYQVNTLTMKDSYHLNEDGHKRAMHKYEVFLQGI